MILDVEISAREAKEETNYVSAVNAFRDHFCSFDLFLLQKTLVSVQLHDSLDAYRSSSLLTKSKSDDIKAQTHVGVKLLRRLISGG